MRTWIIILACCAVLCTYIGFEIGAWSSKVIVIAPKPLLPSLIDIQRRIGAEPDGIYGKETETLWDAAYANQEANQFMTETGAKDVE